MARRMAIRRCALATAVLVVLAGCGGPSGDPPPSPDGTPAVAKPVEIRKDFVILRELTKQHALQTESGNDARLETVARHLQERLNSLPPPPFTPEELTILDQARQTASAR